MFEVHSEHFFTFYNLNEAGLPVNPGSEEQMGAKGDLGAMGKLLNVNTRKKSMQRITQSHNIQ